MIWNLDTMRKVRSLYVRMSVSEEMIEASQGMAEMHAKQQLAEQLKRDCHPLGVEIDLRDVGFQDRPSDAPVALRIYTARWQPMHGLVELFGGPRDGEIVQVAPQLIDWSAPIRFPVVSVDYSAIWEADNPDKPVPIQHLEYRMHGYHEEARAWVYKFYL